MKKRILQSVVAFSLCTVLSTMMASADDGVTRPFRIKAESQMTLTDPLDLLLPYTAEARGQATHLGRIVIRESGHLTSPNNSGVMTTASGERILYQSCSLPDNTIKVMFVTGTGRFSNVSGEFTVQPVVVGGSGLTTYFRWTGKGTISY